MFLSPVLRKKPRASQRQTNVLLLSSIPSLGRANFLDSSLFLLLGQDRTLGRKKLGEGSVLLNGLKCSPSWQGKAWWQDYNQSNPSGSREINVGTQLAFSFLSYLVPEPQPSFKSTRLFLLRKVLWKYPRRQTQRCPFQTIRTQPDTEVCLLDDQNPARHRGMSSG